MRVVNSFWCIKGDCLPQKWNSTWKDFTLKLYILFGLVRYIKKDMCIGTIHTLDPWTLNPIVLPTPENVVLQIIPLTQSLTEGRRPDLQDGEKWCRESTTYPYQVSENLLNNHTSFVRVEITKDRPSSLRRRWDVNTRY